MIGSALGRIAMADRMSVDQLKEALQNKTLPAYIAIPLIEEKMDMQDRMRSSAAAQQARPQPPIAEQVMQRAAMEPGIDRLPTNLSPTRDYAGGGIVAFEEGGEVPRYAKGDLIDKEFKTTDPAKINQAKLDILRAELAEEQRNLGLETDPTKKARIQANITALNREIAAVSKSPSPETSMGGFGKVTKIPSNDPGIAAQRTAMSLPAMPQGQAASTMTPEQMLANARGITDLVYPTTSAPTETTPEKSLEQVDKFYTMAGVDRDIFRKQGKGIEEERAGIAKDKEEAKTFRILEAAAGVLSGTSPFASVNIGKGASPAIQGLASDMKEFQKNERALRAAERDLAMSEQKFNLTRASDAQAQMLRDRDRVDKYQDKRAGLTSDLIKSSNTVEGQIRVAETYGRTSKELELLRQNAPPELVKMADRLKKDMPGKSELERLEVAADIMFPGKGLAAVIGAESKASQDINTQFSNELFTDKKLQETFKKANAGDPDAQREIDERMARIRARVYKNLPALSSRMGETPSVGGAPLPPGGSTQPGQFNVTAPNGKVYSFPTKEQADSFKAQIGG
jgi:hypothetical protein